MTRLAVLGSTGSIGVQALAVAERFPERLEVTALAAGRSLDRLVEQARRFTPAALALEEARDPQAARAELLAAAPGASLWIGPGSAARMTAAIECDVVLNGIVGAAGLAASLAALDGGRRLALANKETLVVGGALVRERLARRTAVGNAAIAPAAAIAALVPVDSEHNAALQCLGGRPAAEIARLTLTASGGALRRHPDWRRASPEEVLAHPTWSMGRRITVDSALLFNKGLELIEAHWLFDLDWQKLDASLHPQALVHALVTFRDGSTVLQAAPADMALPIQLALSWPERWAGSVEPLAPEALEGLSFARIPAGRYPAFDLALAAGREGGTAPCVANAADEVAVQAFLDGAITLGQVPEIVERVLDQHVSERVESLAQLEAVDGWARSQARSQAVRA